MDSKLKDNLLLAVNAKKVLSRKDLGTADTEYADASLIAAYRNVFVNNPEGHIVLADLMKILKFTEKGSDNYHLAMHNIGLEILTRCGIGSDDIINGILRNL